MNCLTVYPAGDRSEQHREVIAAMTAIGIATEATKGKHIAFDSMSTKLHVPPWADMVFVWGASGPEARVIEECRAMKKTCVTLELPYFRGLPHYSVSVDGLHNNGDFLLQAAHDCKRLDAYGVTVYSEKFGGKMGLAIGQVPGDAQLRGNNVSAIIDAYCQLMRMRGFDVLYRPHPGVCPSTTTLMQDMMRCRFAVTWNSTSCVEFIRAGMPFICLDPESQYSLMGTKIDTLAVKPLNVREQWLSNLTHCEVSTKEIAEGKLFSHVADVLKIRGQKNA